MKKYFILFFITVILVTAISNSTTYFKSLIKEVDAIYLDPVSVGDFITCSGKIEYAESKEISANKNSVIKDIYVSEGDEIKKGDKLMTVIDLPDNIDKISIDNYSEQLSKYGNISNLKDIYDTCLRQGDLQTINKSSSNVDTQTKNPTTISAVSSGIVSKLNFSPNSVVKQGDILASIAGTKSFQVRLNVNESRISDIKVGQKAIISGVGFKDKKYTGTVKKIFNEAKQVINSSGPETVVDVIVSLDDCDDVEYIKPGFTAKCKIQTEENKNLMLVPYTMVKADESGKEYVYKYKNGCAFKSYITTGKEFEDGFEVLNGIGKDDMIITNPDSIYNKSYVKLT